jgi:hypothetical protein
VHLAADRHALVHAEKLAWVEKRLCESWVDLVIITKDKTLVGDPSWRCILVDDQPGVDGLVKPPPWQQVLFDAPYNRTAQAPQLSSWARMAPGTRAVPVTPTTPRQVPGANGESMKAASQSRLKIGSLP